MDRVCSDIATPFDNNECIAYHSNCIYFNGGCVNKTNCWSYQGDSLYKCKDILDNSESPKKCWWITGETTCCYRTCQNAPNVTSQSDCTNHLNSCVYNSRIWLLELTHRLNKQIVD